MIPRGARGPDYFDSLSLRAMGSFVLDQSVQERTFSMLPLARLRCPLFRGLKIPSSNT